MYAGGGVWTNQAIASGLYGDVTFSPEELATLSDTFPDGVCDYTQGDARRPANL